MNDLSALARALGGDIVGRQVLCPGPGHSSRDRSLSVMLSPSAPDGFLCFTHSPKDDPLAAKDYVRCRLGLPAFRVQSSRRGETTAISALKIEGCENRDDCAGAARRTRAAVGIWRDSQNPCATIVERYLASRGLELPDEVANDAIRFHPACPWRDTDGKLIKVPAMIGAMRSIATEEIVAVHRTRLTPDGRKVDRRMLGPTAGAAIMLCPFSAVGSGLTVGEGIETCLAAWSMGWSNVWAMGSAGVIVSFPVLPSVQSLVVLAEDDEANRRAVETVGRRYVDASREVFTVHARSGGDMNDAIVREARRCV